MSDFELRQAEADMNEAFVRFNNYSLQLEIKRRQLEFLNVRAPATGTVVNWKLRENLLRRPVQRGQNLMTIVDPDTEWTVELELPERRTIHLQQALNNVKNPEDIQVTFTLASNPGKQFHGKLTRLDQRLDVHSDDGNALLVRVAFDESDIPPELLRDGTRVTAKIEVGTRSLGYVWLHELFETVRASVMFWF